MNNKYQPALFWFAVLNAIATFLLIGLGGLVTSHEAGMSVPDWPTTYGYNMFVFPLDKWVGGIFYEHSHRLLASAVGLLTTILAVWLWLKDARKWIQWLGITAFLLVIVQGILGGLRVRWMLDWLGIPHGAVAQTFLVLTCAIALFVSRWWVNSANQNHDSVPRHSSSLKTRVESHAEIGRQENGKRFASESSGIPRHGCARTSRRFRASRQRGSPDWSRTFEAGDGAREHGVPGLARSAPEIQEGER